MAKDLWLPRGFRLPDGTVIQSLQSSGDEWQIFGAEGGGSVLVALKELARKWFDLGLIEESLFGTIVFGAASFRSLRCEDKYALTAVEGGKSPDKKSEALAFAVALKESRKLVRDASFHDSIYVEQYSRLLPTWTLTPRVDDGTVLGMWITGGVVISTSSFRRLSSLTGWMSQTHLADVIRAAGLDVQADGGPIARAKPAFIADVGERTAIASAEDKQSEPKPRKERGEGSVFHLPGRPQLEEFFNEHVIDIIFNPARYQALGIEFPSAIVLHGPPGCGKTFAVERLVEFIDWPCYSIDSNSVGSPYIHDTSKKISGVFDKAIDSAPSVLVIDEMESFLSERQSGGASGLYHVEEVAEFLRRIPEAIKKRVLIVAMTNMIEVIDPAILRRGRFDHVVEVGMPSRIEVAALFGSLLSTLPLAEHVNLEGAIDALTGRPLSDSAFVVREAARLAAKAGKSRIDQESIAESLARIPRSSTKPKKRFGFVQEP